MKYLIMMLMLFIMININHYRRHRGDIVLNNEINKLNKVIDSMQIQLNAQTTHYKQCLWLDKDSIGITKQGLLYSKHYKKY